MMPGCARAVVRSGRVFPCRLVATVAPLLVLAGFYFSRASAPEALAFCGMVGADGDRAESCIGDSHRVQPRGRGAYDTQA